MKILYLSDDFPPRSFGGAGIVAFRLAKAVCAQGHEVRVITTVQNPSEERTYEYDGLMVYAVYARYQERWRAYLSLYNPQTVSKIQKIVKEFRPDVVHAHNVHQYLSYVSLKIAKQGGARVFLTAHDVMLFHYGKLVEFIKNGKNASGENPDYRVGPWQQLRVYRLRYNPLRNIVIRYYLRYVDKIIAVSNALKDALEQNGIKNIIVIHNGIDPSEWAVDPGVVEEFRKNHALIGKKIVLFGGRLSPAKGGIQAIEALARAVKEVPNAVLLVMGEKNVFAEHITDIARAKGIEKHLIFTGWISGDMLKAAYACADVVLVPSLYLDPFPTINLEAMALKKPVVATCFGGSQELVEDGETGLVVNPFDVNLIAEKIIEAFKVGTVLGLNGFSKTVSDFTQESVSKKILSLYQRVGR